ncbi:MAG: sulfotransferase domain-containing protein [Phycisphaeraceae bacterium]|nr:sulfotransferase domain-containing protein [Phycisphaeraceae bacterium]
MRSTIQRVVLGNIPPGLAIRIKMIATYPRYRSQRRECLRGFERYGDQRRQRLLFVAGLPKSGTTWLEKMISCFPGYGQVMVPELAAYEKRTGGSHDYQLPKGFFDRFERMLVLMKLHINGSPNNVAVLRDAGLRYVVLYRDLRDVAVSYFFYVSRTPWHPEHRLYAGLELQEGLRAFAERTLPAYMDWVRSWRENSDPERSVTLRYETMLDDTRGTIRRVSDLFELDATEEQIEEIIEKTSFKRLSHGREQGEDTAKPTGSFFRKGVAGDWVNQFDERTKELYKSILAEFLIEFGYETDDQW